MFQREHESIFTLYIIVPHWHDAGSWNLSSYKTMTCLFYMYNIIAADDLAPCVARVSATLIYAMLYRINSVPEV